MICRRAALVHSFVLLLSWMLLAGCAARLPRTQPIAVEQREQIQARYSSFQQRECGVPLDADISVELETFGRHLKTSGMLQVLPPSMMRATILDAANRPFFIMVAAGESLTIVNSMQGEAVVGTVSSISAENDEHLDLGSEDVVRLLTGRYTPSPSSIEDVRLDQQSGTYAWLTIPTEHGNRDNILFDPGAERILRHIISDGAGNILLDIRYCWRGEDNGGCSLPSALEMTGKALGGKVTLGYERVMRPRDIPEEIFHLNLPEHYTVRRIE